MSITLVSDRRNGCVDLGAVGDVGDLPQAVVGR
jgi:hypothetical protein